MCKNPLNVCSIAFSHHKNNRGLLKTYTAAFLPKHLRGKRDDLAHLDEDEDVLLHEGIE